MWGINGLIKAIRIASGGTPDQTEPRLHWDIDDSDLSFSNQEDPNFLMFADASMYHHDEMFSTYAQVSMSDDQQNTFLSYAQVTTITVTTE